jgi:hypothetical protein
MRSRVLVSIAVLIVLVLLGAGALLARRLESPAPASVTISVGAERLRLPGGYLREGAEGAVELVAFFPGFAPAAGLGDVTAKTDLADRFERTVFVTLKPADPSFDPTERTERLYQRFLEENSWSHPGGLIARAFVEGSPFVGDELFYVAPDGREFAARCPRPDPQRKTPDTCFSEFREGDIDVSLRFSAALLSQWSALKDGARGLIEAAKR